MSCNSTTDHSFFGYWEVIWITFFFKLEIAFPTIADRRVTRLESLREPRFKWHQVSARRVGRHNLVQRFVLHSSRFYRRWSTVFTNDLAFEVDGWRWKIKVQHGQWIRRYFLQLRDLRGDGSFSECSRLAVSLVHRTSHRIPHWECQSDGAHDAQLRRFVDWIVLAVSNRVLNPFVLRVVHFDLQENKEGSVNWTVYSIHSSLSVRGEVFQWRHSQKLWRIFGKAWN